MSDSDSRPEWSEGSILKVCQPELVTDCDWPTCSHSAVYEIELDFNGKWVAKRVCDAHHAELDIPEELDV